MQGLVRAQKNVERFFAEEKPAQENEQVDKNKLPGVDRKRSASGNLFVSSIFNGIVHLFRLCMFMRLTGILWSVNNTIG